MGEYQYRDAAWAVRSAARRIASEIHATISPSSITDGESSMAIRVCLAGVTGWAGQTLAKSIQETDDIQIVAGVSRQQAGRKLSEALGLVDLSGMISASAEEALATPCDVFVEYTK